MKRTSSEAQAYWELHYHEYQKSGLTVRGYCEAQGIKTNTYCKALIRYKLALDSCKKASIGVTRGGFIEVEHSRAEPSVTIEVNGCMIRVGVGFSRELLKQTLVVLKEV